ncbi:MAG: medium chain dehydrogenase/reductase family protein [Polyangiaceae bacterium]
MRQIWITKAGPPEVLQVREAPDPEAAPGEVRVRVKAAGINFADLMARVGLYPDAPKIPCVVGYEVSGVIDQVGEGVSTFAEGDRVFAMPKFGGYTDTLVISAKQTFRMPDAMSFEAAAALPVAYLTAYNMMIYTGNLRRGARVLVHSAAGGVGLAALELARTRDAVVYGTASKGKHDFLRERGCAHPLDSSGDVYEEARGLLGEHGFDLVLDPVGGASWKKAYDMLDKNGRLCCFGMSAAGGSGKTRSLFTAAMALLKSPKFSAMDLMDKNRTVTGCNMGHLFDRLDQLTEQFEALVAMAGRGEISPHVDRTFGFEEAPLAHHYIHDRKAKGKVLLVPEDAS